MDWRFHDKRKVTRNISINIHLAIVSIGDLVKRAGFDDSDCHVRECSRNSRGCERTRKASSDNDIVICRIDTRVSERIASKTARSVELLEESLAVEICRSQAGAQAEEGGGKTHGDRSKMSQRCLPKGMIGKATGFALYTHSRFRERCYVIMLGDE
jgi:hypothetical protein